MSSMRAKLMPVGFVILILISSWLGNRINTIKDSEAFYRWTISAASLTRLGDTLEPDKSLDVPEAMDDEIYAQLVSLADTALPDYEADPDLDLDPEGNVTSRLARAVRQSHDMDVWALINDPTVADLKQQFLDFRTAHQIQSMGIQFSADTMYSNDTQASGVGLAGLFFGFRTVAANFLWMQVDTFWHNGELHRMVPLMKTCVTLDPNFIDAYLLGAWHLAYNIPAKIEPTPEPLKKKTPHYHQRIGLKEEWYLMAVDFLRDGIRKNPRDYQLYFDLGYGVYEQKLQDHENAILYLDEARRHKHNKWVPRMLFRSLFLNEQYEDAIEGWIGYLEDFPSHDIGDRFLKMNKGFLAETIVDEARECQTLAQASIAEFQAQIEATADAAEISRLESQVQEAENFIADLDIRIKEELDAAVAIWGDLYSDSQDSMALGRMVRRRALELNEMGRHLEAIAELDVVRWEDLQFFDDASNIMIDIKQEAGIPLTVSEQLQVLRKQDVEKWADEAPKREPIRRIDCPYDH
ncbi:MAG: hypothetical protein VCD00_12175 [Candidatus Hydrogenedentota bacterium]